MGKQTRLYEDHLKSKGKMVDFAGWDMPIHYGSQIEEHNSVRQSAGVFDVSHMTVVDIAGEDAQPYLRYLLANDVGRLGTAGDALYSAMLNHEGNVFDDLIVYRMEDRYRLVVNCATRAKDLRWLIQNSDGFRVSIEEKPHLAILAIHGPESINKCCELVPPESASRIKELKYFQGMALGDWFVARTGYTGELGLEFIIPEEAASEFWSNLLSIGVNPIGLGARDTLRLEAGMNLYGQDMDETTSPLAANMERTIAYDPPDREFIGRPALIAHNEMRKAGEIPVLVGLVLEGRGMLRNGQKVLTDLGHGLITSGGFSPTLKHSIALARIPDNSSSCEVELRGKDTSVRIVEPNFVRFGKKVFK